MKLASLPTLTEPGGSSVAARPKAKGDGSKSRNKELICP
jgi:hypothetical protein